MKRDIVSITIAVLFLLFGAATAFAQPTPVQPSQISGVYQVDSLANLYWITQNPSSWDSSFVQTADIDASSDSTWNSGAGFTPIGNSTTAFTGKYDGQNFSISGLFISQVNVNAGMFGFAASAVLKNIRLLNERATTTGSGSIVGGLVGRNLINPLTSAVSDTIENCSTTGMIYGGGSYAGGLVGQNSTEGYGAAVVIEGSFSSASVSGGNGSYVGGLVGDSYSGTLNRCHSTGTVSDSSGTSYVGGLVGYDEGGSYISECYSTGSVTGTGSSATVGGLAGFNYNTSSIYYSYSAANVTSGHDAGGLVGGNEATIGDCYSIGSVGGSHDVGGLVGNETGGTIGNSYSTGGVAGGSSNGGLIGSALGGTVSNSFWDTGSSGQSSSAGGTGEPDSTMKNFAIFETGGWDVINIWGIHSAINNGYPYLRNVTQFSPPAASAPTAVTAAAFLMTGESALLYGVVNSNGDTTVMYFLYGTSSGNYQDSLKASQSPLVPWDSIYVADTLTGLTANTTYYLRFSAKNSLGYARGSEISFTTYGPPTASTDSVSSINGSSATAYGSSNPGGAIDTVWFIYGTVSGTYTDSVVAAQSPITGYSSVHVSANLTGLIPSQKYYLRVSARNSISSSNGLTVLGYARGNEISFTTKPVVAEAAPSGSGTHANPYVISALGNLMWLQDPKNDTAWNRCYNQTANIDASYLDTVNSGAGPLPIGNSTTKFTGTYDGQGHTIENLYISRTSGGDYYQGLFSVIGSSGVIDSLGLTDASVSGNAYAGALAALDSAGATISYCYSTGKVYSYYGYCGGLVGENDGSITESFSTCNVSGGSVPGSSSNMGGLVGQAYSGTIDNSYSTGEVNVGCPGTGGLIGYNSGGAVENCYSVSKVTGSSPSGGLIGDQVSGSLSASFWDTDSTSTGVGLGSSSGATGESSTNMESSTIFTNAHWDFTSTWAINSGVNGGYPYLQSVHDFSLSVQATDFAASANVGSVTLRWKTQSEVNNAGFNILRMDSTISNVGSPIADWKLIASYTSDDSLRGLGTSSTGRSYTFTDNHVVSGGTYQYKIQSVSTSGTVKDLSTLSVTVDVPKVYALYQNYPNPFNPTTFINYQLPMNSQVTLKVYDVLGREVATLVDGQQNAGVYKVDFDGSRFASGVYFYRIVAQGENGQKFVSVKKLLMIK